MNIVLAQINVSLDYKKNLLKIINIIESNKFDILVFPELALTSYNLKKANKIKERKILNAIKKIQEKIQKKKIVIIGTLIYKNNLIYNASAIISRNSIKYYFKNTLTEYDSKYFTKGKDNLIFKFKKFKIGILLCRDQNNIELIKSYKSEDCDIIFHQSAHYYKEKVIVEKFAKNNAMPIVRAIDSNTLFFKVNTVGYVLGKKSLGNSMIVDSKGRILRSANQFQEEIIKYKIKDKK